MCGLIANGFFVSDDGKRVASYENLVNLLFLSVVRCIEKYKLVSACKIDDALIPPAGTLKFCVVLYCSVMVDLSVASIPEMIVSFNNRSSNRWLYSKASSKHSDLSMLHPYMYLYLGYQSTEVYSHFYRSSWLHTIEFLAECGDRYQ